MWASLKGHTEIVKMLLADSRLDANMQIQVRGEMFLLFSREYLKYIFYIVWMHGPFVGVSRGSC